MDTAVVEDAAGVEGATAVVADFSVN